MHFHIGNNTIIVRLVRNKHLAEFDLTSGLPPARDLYLASPPADPDCRESASLWVFDEAGRFGFPRICVEAISKSWSTHGLQVNLAFPDGRVLVSHGSAAAHPGNGADNLSPTFGAGPLQFTTIDPFGHLNVRYDGEMRETTVANQMRGEPLGPTRHVRFEIKCTISAPPWVPGTMSLDARRRMASGGEANAMGGERYEQLLRAKGHLSIADDFNESFSGSGLRIHRVGSRNTSTMPGHCWQSALFPSGKGFGFIAFPADDEKSTGYNEGYIFDGRNMIGARATVIPWIREFAGAAGKAALQLETEAGEIVEIGCELSGATCIPQGEPMFGDWPHHPKARLFYHQGCARYQWGEEQAFGMIERSLPRERVRLDFL